MALHKKEFKILLAAGADINAKDSNNSSILSFMVRKNIIKMIDYLLDNGSDIETRDSVNMTPLMIAVYQNQPEITDILVKRGAKVDAQTSDGHTPLMMACMKSSVKIVRTLKDAYADPSVRDKKSRTALFYAVRRGDIDIVKEILSLYMTRADFNFVLDYQDSKGHTLLVDAIIEKKFDIAELLIKSGIDTSLRTHNGSTALSILNNYKDSQEKTRLLNLLNMR